MDTKILTPEFEKKILSEGEALLWRSEGVGSLGCGKVILLILFVIFILVPVIGLSISMLVSTIFFTSTLNIFIKVILGILLFFGFIYFLIWLTRYIFHYGFYISNKRIILLESSQKYGISFLILPEPTYSDIEDIEFIKSLDEKRDNYTKFLIKSYFYKYFFGIKLPKLWKTYRYIYLNPEGLEIMNKLLKEKAPNSEVK